MTVQSALSGDATWALDPGGIDHWNDPSSWVPQTVPDGPDDVATFGLSNSPFPILFSNVEVNGLVFQKNAAAFTIHLAAGYYMTISGAGITNRSSVVQTFDLSVITGGRGATLQFSNTATAGVATQFTLVPGMSGGSAGVLNFVNSSTAGAGLFINEGAGDGSSDAGLTSFEENADAAAGSFFNKGGESKRAAGGTTRFSQNATAGHGTFVSEPGTAALAQGGLVQFLDSSSAADGTFTNNGAAVAGEVGSGLTQFLDQSTSPNATLIGNGGTNGAVGGTIQFGDDSSGGASEVQVFGNGNLDISAHNQPGLTIASLVGDGMVFLGANNLTIGSDSLSSTFAGVIEDGGGNGGADGSISKTGESALTLSKASLYTGGTDVNQGSLIVSNTSGSATGSGAVQVNAGTLGGSGIISGAVTVGTGSGSGAFLAPAHGMKKQATLTIQSVLILNSDATYTCTFKAKGKQARSDAVSAQGITINTGAAFDFEGQSRGQLREGLTLTVINNTSATPIAGVFNNLADGAILTVNGNNFEADYEGGDGNDLTLTVVP